MDQISWVYNGYLVQLSNLNIHYQNLTILVLGGIGASYKIIQKKHCAVNFLFFISFLICIGSLILGLKTYQSILATFQDLIVKQFAEQNRYSDIAWHKIGYINFQFYMSLIAVIFFFIAHWLALSCEE
jgi:hypothetical protein